MLEDVVRCTGKLGARQETNRLLCVRRLAQVRLSQCFLIEWNDRVPWSGTRIITIRTQQLGTATDKLPSIHACSMNNGSTLSPTDSRNARKPVMDVFSSDGERRPVFKSTRAEFGRAPLTRHSPLNIYRQFLTWPKTQTSLRLCSMP